MIWKVGFMVDILATDRNKKNNLRWYLSSILCPELCLVFCILMLSACMENKVNIHHSNPEHFARQIVHNIEKQNITALASAIHPIQGVQFSPYSHFSDKTDVTLYTTKLLKEWHDTTPKVWGYYDGSGEKIVLNTKEYFSQFVSDRNYSNAPIILVNKLAKKSNTRSNIEIFFSNSTFVDFYYPGNDPKFGGMDWSSLRIILIPNQKGGWWLRGLAHGRWTI